MIRGGGLIGVIRRIAADERRMKSKQNVSLNGHLPLSTLLHPRSLPVTVALLTAEDVATDTLVEHAETVGHEVANVGQIEERQRNAEKGVDNGNDATQRRLRSNVTVAYHTSCKS